MPSFKKKVKRFFGFENSNSNTESEEPAKHKRTSSVREPKKSSNKQLTRSSSDAGGFAGDRPVRRGQQPFPAAHQPAVNRYGQDNPHRAVWHAQVEQQPPVRKSYGELEQENRTLSRDIEQIRNDFKNERKRYKEQLGEQKATIDGQRAEIADMILKHDALQKQ